MLLAVKHSGQRRSPVRLALLAVSPLWSSLSSHATLGGEPGALPSEGERPLGAEPGRAGSLEGGGCGMRKVQ